MSKFKSINRFCLNYVIFSSVCIETNLLQMNFVHLYSTSLQLIKILQNSFIQTKQKPSTKPPEVNWKLGLWLWENVGEWKLAGGKCDARKMIQLTNCLYKLKIIDMRCDENKQRVKSGCTSKLASRWTGNSMEIEFCGWILNAALFFRATADHSQSRLFIVGL